MKKLLAIGLILLALGGGIYAQSKLDRCFEACDIFDGSGDELLYLICFTNCEVV